MAPFSGLCRNVTAQSHLDLKVWSCHTLRNELLGTASVSLGNLLKSGGKRTYKLDPTGVPQPPPWLWSPCSAGSCCLARPVGAQWGGEAVATAAPMQSPAPGGNKVPLCALGRLSGLGCDGSHTSVSQGAAACTETQTPQLFAAICGRQSVARDSSYCIKAAIQVLGHASGCAGLEKARSVFSKQSSTTRKRQTWY